LIPVPASDQFIARLKAGVKKAGYSNRSQFIRDAIIEKLDRSGIKLPAGLAKPPIRGRRTRTAKPKAKRAVTTTKRRK